MTVLNIHQRFLVVRQSQFIIIVMYGLALLAWVAILWQLVPMPGTGMEMQMSDPGVPEAMALGHGLTGLGLYLAMWGTMMIAMMYPSSVPVYRLYHSTLSGASRVKTYSRLIAMLGTYTLVWTLTGLVPLTVNRVVPIAILANEYGMFLFGGMLIVLGGYQLSPYKYQCLEKCRSPLGFLMTEYRLGVTGAARLGWRFSWYCVGCCWALFAFMVVAGSMNILWMAVITIVLSLERMVSWGEWLAAGTGVLASVAGTGLILRTLM